MNINYYNPYVRKELMLYHHGVLGQRWGKKNGPPYPIAAGDHSASEKKAGWRKSLIGKIGEYRRQKADRKSGVSDLSTKKDKNSKTVNDVNTNVADTNNTVDETTKRHREQISKVTKTIEDHDILGESRIHELDASKNPEDKKRIRDAADLGIKALDKMGIDAADDINHITDDDREWFVYEDQTIGLTTIADMVNRGKSKEQIRNAIKAADDIDYDYDEDTNISENHSEAIFELQEAADEESYYLRRHGKSFVDACYEVKAEQDETTNRVDHEKRYQEVVSKASKIVDEHDVASTIKMEQLNASDNPKDKKRVKDAADLGIKALDRIEGNAADDINNITDSDRERFMFDYQNIGLGQVADMVNRGKSKDQVKGALKAAMDVAEYDFFDDPQLSQNQSNSIMDLQEVAIREKRNDKSFVDACYEVKAERDKSNKENTINKNASLAKSMYRSGQSYAEIAKRLGISESNVQYLLYRK